jgi:uncharacterized protein (DUF983 family)
MNGPMAFCPRCQKDVHFIDAGQSRRCTVCGLEFERSSPGAYEPDSVTTAVMTVGHVLLRAFLILGVTFLVGVAVLFASCALH